MVGVISNLKVKILIETTSETLLDGLHYRVAAKKNYLGALVTPSFFYVSL